MHNLPRPFEEKELGSSCTEPFQKDIYNTGQHYGRFCKIHNTWTEVEESCKSWTKGPITVSQDNRPPLSTWRLDTLTQSSGINNKGQDAQMHEPYLR